LSGYDKRRQAAALQDAGAIHSVLLGSAQVVEILLEGWHFVTQVFDFPQVADKLRKLCVNNWLSCIYKCNRKSLIFRGLPRFSEKFHPFLTCKWVDLPSVTTKQGDFFKTGPFYCGLVAKSFAAAGGRHGLMEATISGRKRLLDGQIRRITPPSVTYHRIPPLKIFLIFEI
jgi:hypothetical protein